VRSSGGLLDLRAANGHGRRRFHFRTPRTLSAGWPAHLHTFRAPRCWTRGQTCRNVHRPTLECRHSTLIVTNTDGVINAGEKDLAVSNATGARDRDDGLHRAIYHLIGQDEFKLNLG